MRGRQEAKLDDVDAANVLKELWPDCQAKSAYQRVVDFYSAAQVPFALWRAALSDFLRSLSGHGRVFGSNTVRTQF